MQNFENYRGKELRKAAEEFVRMKHFDSFHEWNRDDWSDFAYWLFDECKFKFKIEYKVSNVPHLQEFIIDATDPTDAERKFLEFMGQNKSSVKIFGISSGGEE